ncbi:hypothetical protein HJB86_21365 [Rhizobium sp. NZLR3b]|uniref:hypothetical protein n=1 Tax=Rhizobium sp. NZLR3b TaxID=2731101 RepID=UPI001C839FBC|nr:hypothetical protein [Rhizobium sp. NZLR3b]MBX5191433.1 hypothetical protein [Rhizobium sp. NZLR3b]
MLELILPPKRIADEKARPHVRHYDAWLTAGGDGLITLTDRIFEMLQPPSLTEGRKPRADAAERRKVCTMTLVANLVVAALSPACYGGLAMPLMNNKLTRYDRRGFTADVLRQVINEVENVGLVSVEKAIFKEQRTIVAPTQCFRQLIAEHGVSLADIRHLEGRETIELRAGSKRARDKTLVDYKDCHAADTLRAQMEEINEVLNGADIRFGGDQIDPIHLVRQFRIDQPEDDHTFDRHGRLYGGFWEGLPKEQRCLLTIGGEPVVDLDFVSMFVQLAYCHETVEPPPGDLYAVPGLEEYRKAAKASIVSLFFRKAKAQRLPPGIKEELPAGWNMNRIKAAVAALHPGIAHLFDSNVGFELMAMESEVLVGILLELASKGVAALPMHDGIMVAGSQKQLAIDTMQRVSEEKVGRPLQVAEKEIKAPSPNNSPLWSTTGCLRAMDCVD